MAQTGSGLGVRSSYRRHLFVTAWATLSAQVLVLALGITQVCRDRQHTHAGIAAPDCPMHHDAPGGADGAHHSVHHGDARPADDVGGGQQITCHCSGDATSIFFTQPAIVPAPPRDAPFIPAVRLDPPGEPSTPDFYFSPPSPPPR